MRIPNYYLLELISLWKFRYGGERARERNFVYDEN